MNNLVNVNQITITSLELSKLTGRRHDHLINSIKKMSRDLEIMNQPTPRVGEYLA